MLFSSFHHFIFQTASCSFVSILIKTWRNFNCELSFVFRYSFPLMAATFGLQVRLRVSIATQPGSEIAVDTELSDLHLCNETALLHRFESLLGFLSSHHIDLSRGVDRVEWDGDNGANLLETLDRVWMEGKRAIIYLTAIPHAPDISDARHGTTRIQASEDSRPRRASGAVLRSFGDDRNGDEASNRSGSSGNPTLNGPSQGAWTHSALPNASLTSIDNPGPRGPPVAFPPLSLQHPRAATSTGDITPTFPSSPQNQNWFARLPRRLS